MRLVPLLLCVGLVWGQGTTPKASAGEYEVHASTPGVELGAELMVHSVLLEDQSAVVPGYLVIEVALFPPKGFPVNVARGGFQLRLNGKPLVQATPEMAAASLVHSQWNSGVGNGNTGMPGQRPPVPRVPGPAEQAGVPQTERLSAPQLVVKGALPEGQFQGPVSGYLYFPYRGKTAGIRSLELLYGETVLKLR